MKKENLHEAFGQVKDEYINSANELRTHNFKRRNRTGLIAAACAIVILGGAVGFWITQKNLVKPDGPDPNSGTKTGNSQTDKSFEIAVYKDKKTAQYPKADEFTNNNQELSEKWWKEHQKRMEGIDKIVDSTSPFYKKLMSELLSKSDITEENTVYSPTNLYLALSVLANVTEGDSRQEILDLLSAESVDDLKNNTNKIFTACTIDDGLSKVTLANSLWLDNRITYNNEKLKDIATNYFASSYHGESGSAEYDEVFRKWLDDHTGNLLGDMTKNMKLSPDNLLTIASTIYFKEGWQEKFHKENNYNDKFTVNGKEKDCEFMYRSDKMEYYKGSNYSAVSVPFRSEGKMWLILPDEKTTVSELANSEDLNKLIIGKAETEYPKVNLSVPKFDVSSDLNLIKTFKSLGLNNIFYPNNDNISGITKDGDEYEAFVSQIEHGARVKIDEEGCEAAAFTVIAVTDNAMVMEDQPIDFKLDRPFMFVVSNQGNLPLFTGVVNNPNE